MRVFAQLVFLLFLAEWGYGQSSTGGDSFSSFEHAKKHMLHYDKPAVDFFEGALLGNGGMGVVVTTRPDAVVLYFGHNNVWDIRIAEDHRQEIGTFGEVFDRISAISDTLSVLTDDPWYKAYRTMARENYSKPYPRPFPCGSIVLGFDRKDAELIGHTLDISAGLCEVKFLTRDKKEVKLQVFTSMQEDKLWMRLVDMEGEKVANIFNRLRVMPDPSTPKEFPPYTTEENLNEGVFSFRQVLPYEEPDQYDAEKGHPQDRAFRLTVSSVIPLRKEPRLNWDGIPEEMHVLEGALAGESHFSACISLAEGLSTAVAAQVTNAVQVTPEAWAAARQSSLSSWKEYWSKSGVELEDAFLEEIWYRNLYFFNCAAKDGVTPPGLFANWSYNDIGTAWHGDYHMNYNTQQPYWMTFSSNHLEKNLPYVGMIESLMSVSRKWAREYYQLPGAYFPHSAYPVEMTMNPYPLPDWGWEICETPWAVQGLWWHYLYSGDKEFLEQRAYTPIREAVEFLVAYMQRPEARGGQRWQDDNYHIFPTIPPELYSLRPGFKYNYDVNIDLALTKFIFKAFLEAVSALDRETEEKALTDDIREILAFLPEYPTAVTESGDTIPVSVPGEHDQVVYNVPLALSTVFPGEDHGLHSGEATMDILENTFRNQQNEGGNDLVFINLQAARIGLLDLERFKRQVNYSLLPNGTATDMVMQVHGRYSDRTSYDYMGDMGIWFENFGLPVVINECLMQSYTGAIRLFPNWPENKDAVFRDLRAAGAFLVSAEMRDGKVTGVDIRSERGGMLRIFSPWGESGTLTSRNGRGRIGKELIEISTSPGETISLRP